MPNVSLRILPIPKTKLIRLKIGSKKKKIKAPFSCELDITDHDVLFNTLEFEFFARKCIGKCSVDIENLSSMRLDVMSDNLRVGTIDIQVDFHEHEPKQLNKWSTFRKSMEIISSFSPPCSMYQQFKSISHLNSIQSPIQTVLYDDLEYLKYMNKFFVFSLVAFGVKGLILLGLFREVVKFKHLKSRKILLSLMGLESSNILYWSKKAALFHPFFFVVFKNNEIVISIRGTMNFSDCLTDAYCEYVPFMDGYAHSGILLSAQNLFPIILQTISNLRPKRIVVTGFSLGAGVAHVLGILLSTAVQIPVDVECFASPPVVSEKIAERYKHFKTIVYNNDIVPRLSYGSLQEYKHLILNKESKVYEKLFIPGKIIYLQKQKHFVAYECNEIHQKQQISQIVLNSGAVLDHHPARYRKALLSLTNIQFLQ